MDEAQLIRLIATEVVKELQRRGGDAATPAATCGEHGTGNCAVCTCGGGTNPSAAATDPHRIRIGVSVRHVHLCQADLEILYGPGAVLHKERDLYQEGEFAAQETVTLVGPRMRALTGVRVLGPLRKRTQVELARTDAIGLGLDPPVRPSGELDGSAPIIIVGPRGAVTLKEGAIRANRHIHMNEEDARYFGVQDGELVAVEIGGEKALIFKGVQVRVSPKFRLEMHLDTDDANAAGVTCGVAATIVGKGA